MDIEWENMTFTYNAEHKPVWNTESHSYSEWETVEESTCSMPGMRRRSCSVCNTFETESVLDHNFDYYFNKAENGAQHYENKSGENSIIGTIILLEYWIFNYILESITILLGL